MGGGAAQVQVAKEWEVGSGRVGDGATGMVFVLLHFYGIVWRSRTCHTGDIGGWRSTSMTTMYLYGQVHRESLV